jgi:hypothetical protein
MSLGLASAVVAGAVACAAADSLGGSANAMAAAMTTRAHLETTDGTRARRDVGMMAA